MRMDLMAGGSMALGNGGNLFDTQPSTFQGTSSSVSHRRQRLDPEHGELKTLRSECIKTTLLAAFSSIPIQVVIRPSGFVCGLCITERRKRCITRPKAQSRPGKLSVKLSSTSDPNLSSPASSSVTSKAPNQLDQRIPYSYFSTSAPSSLSSAEYAKPYAEISESQLRALKSRDARLQVQIQECIQALRKDKSLGKKWMQLARLSSSQHEKIQILSSAVLYHVNRKNPFLWHALGTAYARNKQEDDAIRTFLRGIRLSPKGSRAALYQSLALIFVRRKDQARAERMLKRGLADDKHHGPLYVALSELYRKSEKNGVALKVLLNAMKMNAMHAPIWRSAASLLQRLERLELARDCWGVVTILEPKDWRAWLHLADVVEFHGDSSSRKSLADMLEATWWRELSHASADPSGNSTSGGPVADKKGKPANRDIEQQRKAWIEATSELLRERIILDASAQQSKPMFGQLPNSADSSDHSVVSPVMNDTSDASSDLDALLCMDESDLYMEELSIIQALEKGVLKTHRKPSLGGLSFVEAADERNAALLVLRQGVRLNMKCCELRVALAKMELEQNGAAACRAVLERGIELATQSQSTAPTGARKPQVKGNEWEILNDSSAYLLYSALGALEASAGNQTLSRNLYKKAVDLERRNLSSERNSVILPMETGPKAQPSLHKMDTLGGESLHAWALSEVKAGDRRMAKKVLNKATELCPTHGGLWRALGELEKSLRNVELARSAFGRAIACSPGDLRVWLSWGMLEKDLSNYERAKELLGRAAAVKLQQSDEGMSRIAGNAGNQITSLYAFRAPRNVLRTRAHALQELAMICEREGKYQESEEFLRLGLKIDPGFGVLYRMLGETVAILHRKDIRKVRQEYYSMIRAAPNRLRCKIWHWFGLFERRKRNYRRALTCFRVATKLQPKYMAAWMSYAFLQNEMNRSESALALLDSAAKIAEVNRINAHYLFQAWSSLYLRVRPLEPDVARDILRRGMRQYSLGSVNNPASHAGGDKDYEQRLGAASMLEGGIADWMFEAQENSTKLDQDDDDFDMSSASSFRSVTAKSSRAVYLAQLQLALGQLEERQARIDAARELYQAACNSAPSYAPAFQRLGLLEQKRRNFKAAKQAFSDGAEADTKSGVALSLWAMMEARHLNNISAARELFERAAAVEPRNAAIWHSWGQMEAKHSNVKQARDLLLKAAHNDPEDTISWVSLARLESLQGDADCARSYFEKALSADPSSAILWQSLALMEERIGEGLVKARETFEKGSKFIDANADIATLYYPWAKFECRYSNFDRAAGILNQGLALDPSSSRLYLGYAELYRDLCKIDKARSYFEMGVRVDPGGCAPIYCAWAKMESAEKNVDRARRLYQNAIRVDPSHESSWRGYAELEEIEGNRLLAEELRMAAAGVIRQSDATNEQGEDEDDDWLSSL